MLRRRTTSTVFDMMGGFCTHIAGAVWGRHWSSGFSPWGALTKPRSHLVRRRVGPGVHASDPRGSRAVHNHRKLPGVPGYVGTRLTRKRRKLLIRLQARRCSARGHVFECPPSSVRNPDPADIDQLSTSVDDLMSYRYQPSLSQKEKHSICETEVRTQVCFGAALLVDQQL
jgi:hypothetical protein